MPGTPPFSSNRGAPAIESDCSVCELRGTVVEPRCPDEQARCWLPSGKTAALCFSIDDIHPERSTGAYEAGGDLGKSALGRLEWLLKRHPKLRVTLFATADWREISPRPTRKLLASLPWVRDRVYLTKRLRRPEFRWANWCPTRTIPFE